MPDNKVPKYLSWLPVVLKILGIAMLVVSIAVLIPAVLPKVTGIQPYEITTGSMEPSIPVGSVVYVQEEDPTQMQSGDVVAYDSDGTVIVHRVEQNMPFEGRLITKGDANDQADLQPVPYQDVLGKVVLSLPVLGGIYSALTGIVGKIYMACFILAAVLLCILSSQLASRRKMLKMQSYEK